MKKIVALFLAVLLVISLVPMSAMATGSEITVNSISAVAKKTLKEKLDGYYHSNDYFYYVPEMAEWQFTVNYGNNQEITGDSYELFLFFDSDPMIYNNQSELTPWGLGRHEVTVEFMGKSCQAEVEVVDNGIKSVDATVGRPLYQGLDDTNIHMPDMMSGMRIQKVIDTYEITMDDDTVIKGTYDEICCKFGYGFSVASADNCAHTGDIGKHTAVVSLGGVSKTIEIEIQENPYKAIEISDNGEFSIDFIKHNDSRVTAKAEYFDYNNLYTDKGRYQYSFITDEADITKNVQLVIGDLESNVLTKSNWYKEIDYSETLASFLISHNGVFYDGTITKDNIDDMLCYASAITETMFENYDEPVEYDGYFYIPVSVDEAREVLSKLIDITNVDFSLALQQPETDNILVEWAGGFGGGYFQFPSTHYDAQANEFMYVANGYSPYVLNVPLVSRVTLKWNDDGLLTFAENINNGKWIYDGKGWWYQYLDGTWPSNGWDNIEDKWYYFDEEGYMLSNCWKKDSVGWCYLGSDGAMKTNSWIMDSVGWCYVGSDGYCVTNSWMKDSIGWCYLDSEGRMATNKWILDSVGWCYVGSDGYCVTNCWMKDSIGWCYLDSEGRMATNKWILDSVGWCYVGSDGYCVTNSWMKDSVGWCYLDSAGRMVYNQWVQDSSGWCYIGADGYMV